MKNWIVLISLLLVGCGGNSTAYKHGVIINIGSDKELQQVYKGKYQGRMWEMVEIPYTDIRLDNDAGIVRLQERVGEIGVRILVTVPVDDKGNVIGASKDEIPQH